MIFMHVRYISCNRNMATLPIFRRLVVFNNLKEIERLYKTQLSKHYSQFPKNYIKPIFKTSEQKQLEENNELSQISHIPILPAHNTETSSEFHDDVMTKFTNYIMRKGKKELARNLLRKTFENIKRIQVERYNRAPPDQRDTIELDPKVILYQAIENTSPVLELVKMKKGGISYQVPIPIRQTRSTFLACNWLIHAGKEKERKVHLPEKLAHELIDASLNQGRVVNKKKELYKQCEANRAYAHFRWA